MANSRALFVVALVLASLCVANAGRISAEPGRKLIAAPEVTRKLVLVFDLTKLKKTVAPGTVTLKENVQGVKSVVAKLVPRYVTELKAAQVHLQEAGIVRVLVRILGLTKVIALDLEQLKATLIDGEVRAVVVLVVEKVKKTRILHFRNHDGKCLTSDAALSNFTTDGQAGGLDFQIQA